MFLKSKSAAWKAVPVMSGSVVIAIKTPTESSVAPVTAALKPEPLAHDQRTLQCRPSYLQQLADPAHFGTTCNPIIYSLCCGVLRLGKSAARPGALLGPRLLTVASCSLPATVRQVAYLQKVRRAGLCFSLQNLFNQRKTKSLLVCGLKLLLGFGRILKTGAGVGNKG